MPAMVSLIEAIDWFVGVGESFCVPRSVERWFLVRLKERVEGIILSKIIAIISSHGLVILVIAILMILVSWIHYYYVCFEPGVKGPCASLKLTRYLKQ
jgi:hypothetical protein